MTASNQKPTLLFMGRIFSDTAWGGVREMAVELLTSLGPICEKQNRMVEVLVPEKDSCPVQHPNIKEVVLEKFSNRKMLWDHLSVSKYANQYIQPAVLHNIKLVLPLNLKIPGFTSIHDLMYFPQPAKYDWREYLFADSMYMRMMVPRTLRIAPYTHMDSFHTAKDAMELFPKINEEKYKVIHLGIRPERWSPENKKDGDEKRLKDLEAKGASGKFILYCGGLSKRKNPTVLLHAFKKFHEHFPDWKLIVTGGFKPTNADPKLQELIASMPKDNFIKLGFVDERSLTLLYHKAMFSVFPSLYEGFGLPALESQAAHCPLICSNRTSLAEIAKGSSRMIDPESVDEMVKAMEKLAQSEEERNKLVEAGKENIEQFSWDKTADEFLKLADEVYSASKFNG